MTNEETVIAIFALMHKLRNTKKKAGMMKISRDIELKALLTIFIVPRC